MLIRQVLRALVSFLLATFVATALASATPVAAEGPRDDSAPLRIFLRAGPKTHGPGEHDHPRFLEDWKLLLTKRGATVEGALRFPTEEELARTDVLVMYAAEAGTVAAEDRAHLEAYLARGGGIVALHDAVCGADPAWFKTIIGGSWEHGHSKWEIGEQGLYFSDEESPVTGGVTNFDLTDEIYYDLHLEPGAKVLAASFRTVFDIEPQMWTYEKDDYRSFVAIQGHYYETFSNPAWRTLVLRGIAWAGKHDVNALVTADEVRGLRYPPGGPTAPELADTSFELHPGFSAQLVAAEPHVINPISIDWDASGRMWVATTPGYPYKQASSGVEAHDRVLILEDENADGTMEQAKVFAGGLDLITSLVFHEDGVIVTQAPDILWLRDRDGDDVADERVVLFTGFGFGDTHAVTSNLRWGPDGWIYGTQGYSAGASRHVTNASGHDFGRISNGVFRFRPDGSAIELVSSYGSNTWGLDFDADGELFFTMANGSHLRHVVLPEGVLGGARVGGVNSWTHLPDHREARPLVDHARSIYQQIDFVGGFTAAAGSLIYDGGTWPAEFDRDHFVCEPTISLVHRDHLEQRGVSFTASKPREPEFMASTDLWFRPVHLRTGPDGAMYVLDFYNQAASHNDTRGPDHGPTNAAIRPDRDKQHGRIWRVQYQDAAVLPELARQDDVEALISALSSSNSWQRESAQRRLRELGTSRGAVGVAERVAKAMSAETTAAARVQMLWLLQTLGLDADMLRAQLRRSLDDEHAGVRRTAARIAALVEASPELDEELWKTAAKDTDPRASLLAFVALGSPERTPLSHEISGGLVSQYGLLEDDWSRTACLRALSSQGSQALFAAQEAGALELAVELATRLGRRAQPAEVDGFIAGSTGEDPSGLAATLRALRQALPGNFVPSTSPEALDSLRSMLNSADLEVVVASVALADRVDTQRALDSETEQVGKRLLAQLDDEEVSFATALSCLEALVTMPDARAEALSRTREFVVASAPLDVQTRAIEIVAEASDPAAGLALASSLPEMSATAREQALAALLAREEWAAILLDEVEAERVRVIDLGPRAVHSLKHYPTAELAARALRVFGSGANADLDALVTSLLPVVTAPGDTTRGAALFMEHCGICHTFNDEGAAIGPELTGMGAHGAATLLPLILDPNREVDPAYLEYVLRRVDGRTETGLMVRETAESVVLRSTNGDVEVPRAEIEELRSSGLSLMPTGLETLGGDVMRDILAYLCDEYTGYAVVDMTAVMNANTAAGMYDPERDSTSYRFTRTGVIDVEGVPFVLQDPETSVSGFNALVLKGGPYEGWRCKEELTQRVELALPADVGRVHVLGGIAAFGYPWGGEEGTPIVGWTWQYADGTSEKHVLHDAVEFADWIGRNDVPGSRWVEGLVANNSYGQVRTFSMTPNEDKPLRGLLLESFDNFLAPTFLGLTVEGAQHAAARAEAREDLGPAEVLIFGGGSSHDFERWFRDADLATLRGSFEGLDARYTDRARDLATALGPESVLVFCTNQALDDETRGRMDNLAPAGGGLLVLHAGTWRNHEGWPAMTDDQIGGGTSSHEALQVFDVEVNDAGLEWLLAGDLQELSASFEIRDELYRFEAGPDPQAITVLAEGVSRESGARYPVLWTREVGAGRVVGCTLGHDGDAHGHPMFEAILARAVQWLREEH